MVKAESISCRFLTCKALLVNKFWFGCIEWGRKLVTNCWVESSCAEEQNFEDVAAAVVDVAAAAVVVVVVVVVAADGDCCRRQAPV